MIQSMTGYGKSEGLLSNNKISVQLKSLNSKQSDIHVKIPNSFREKELEYRKLLSNLLGRGKIELYIQYESQSENSNFKVNEDAFKSYYKQLKAIKEDLGDSADDISLIVSRFPEIVINEEEELEDEEWEKIEDLIQKCASNLIQFREAEGEKLYLDLKSHIDNILSLLNDALRFEEERTQTVKERLKKNIDETIDSSKLDKDRFEQELIYYMEKFDISEEKVRLKGHCDYFLECMNMPAGQGRKLGFIGQEIGREINTLGSKANHGEMQKLVVQMKDELEKIKEQVLNVW